MFRKKLEALGFVQIKDFDPSNDLHFRNLILWLEDQKIRHYKIEDRQGLRTIEIPEEWNKAFQKYLEDIKCPYPLSGDRLAIIDWILGLAVRYEYGDNAAVYKEQTGEKVVQTRAEANPQLISENPLDKLKFDEPDFKNGVQELVDLLTIPSHPDHLVQLKAINKLIQTRLSNKAIQEVQEEKKGEEGTPMKLDKFELGFDAGDYVLNEAARILRLLHVCELRDLQTKINETIVAVQNVTANPKTDERLGKVGF